MSCRAMHTAVYDEHELFSMTKYRWLYNNEKQLTARYMPFNVEALLNIATQSANAKQCTSLEKIHDGTFNRVLDLKFDNGVEYVVKIPFPITGPKHLCTASEVATLDYIRTELSIPVPEVRSWSSHAERTPVGTEYIMYENIPGTPLSYYDITDLTLERDPFIRILPAVVAIETKMTERAFSLIGALYYKEDVPEHLRRDWPLHTKTEYRSPNSARFCVGPTIEREFWRAGRSTLDIDRGPWPDDRAYMVALGKCASASIEAGLDADPDGAYRDLVSKYEKLIPFIAPERTAVALWHPELHAGNIIINDKKEEPSSGGIIDWQGSVVAPYYRQFQVPPAYEVDEGTELVVHGPGVAPKLVDGYDELSAEEQDRAQRILRRAWRAYMHEIYLRRQDEKLAMDLYSHDDGANILRLTTMPSSAITAGAHYEALLYTRWSLKMIWDVWIPIVGITEDGGPAAPFPFPFTEEDAQRIDEELKQYRHAESICNDILTQFGIKPESEGLVKAEKYEETKKAVEAALQAALDGAPSAEERNRIAEVWPLREGKVSLTAERCW
ncbi:kinase-like domain-containing protein [Schizophyllum amplum]|uniref:Altered inheritance of mitochondria protein 9, mitochondrial n=1 Tax=Schizophyllum amplum TaxID=97359 RepID=A0A550CLA4_9AGAR|nr:kinase-like domain-containing protein [Auriculariopsis ampla]